MDDNLEKFIKSHREELDDRSPRKNLWADIEKEVGEVKIQHHHSGSMVYWRAAAVILLLISSWLVFDKVYQPEDNTDTAELSELNPQFAEAESYYISLIDTKREEIKSFSKNYNLGESFLYEIDKLDSMYGVLKKDMKYGNDEEIADAMIMNLQIRIEILNQQLSIIQSIEKSQKDEKEIL
jgi:hypothetical protein